MSSPKAVSNFDIVVFDDSCVFCTANAQLVIRYDRARRFRFASMRSDAGRTLFSKAGVNFDDPESLVVLTQGMVLRDSDAVLHIYRHLGWPWRLAAAFKLVPRWLRDPTYRLVARNRYKWFGRRNVCWVPGPEDRERML